MGKLSIIAAIAFSFIGYILLENMQQASRESDLEQSDYLSGQIARELAIKGRKLVLANWINSGGAAISHLNSISENGGTISTDPADFSIVADTLDFKVRGTFNGAVHDIRSRLLFVNFDANPFQIKAVDLDLTIDPNAHIDIPHISLDDQAINELETVLIDDLGLGTDLSDFNLGSGIMMDHIEEELLESGITIPDGIDLMEQADRDEFDQQNGMFFPDQVQQAIETYISSNDGSELTIAYGNNFPATFGESGPTVLRIEDNVSIPAYTEVTGEGILIVEGNLIVEDNATFNWDGLILIIPPASNLNPHVNFFGESNITGTIIALQESVPTSGHMDVTTFRDTTGVWASPYGVDREQSHWPWWLFHTHDYTLHEGSSAVFFAPTSAERIHEDRLFFFDTLQDLNPNDEIFLEYYNPAFHGRGLLTLDLLNLDESIYPVAPGFDPDLQNAGNAYRSMTFNVSDLERLQIDITRLSSLRKLWDDTENPFPDCTTWGGINGAICVGETHYRQNAFTLRLYKENGGFPKRIYETSFYWHRQEVEEDDFEAEMEEYVDTINSPNFGLNLVFGDSTSFVFNQTTLHTLSGFTGGESMGMHNLGTWHRHWEAGDPDNPIQYEETPSSDD